MRLCRPGYSIARNCLRNLRDNVNEGDWALRFTLGLVPRRFIRRGRFDFPHFMVGYGLSGGQICIRLTIQFISSRPISCGQII